jgi:hypothetical protein
MRHHPRYELSLRLKTFSYDVVKPKVPIQTISFKLHISKAVMMVVPLIRDYHTSMGQ